MSFYNDELYDKVQKSKLRYILYPLYFVTAINMILLMFPPVINLMLVMRYATWYLIFSIKVEIAKLLILIFIDMREGNKNTLISWSCIFILAFLLIYLEPVMKFLYLIQ